jgi:hypothetical protein
MAHPARALPQPSEPPGGELIHGPWKAPDPILEPTPAHPRADRRPTTVPTLDVVITFYGGNSREQAAADVWTDWQRRYPNHHIRVHHPDEAWEPVR